MRVELVVPRDPDGGKKHHMDPDDLLLTVAETAGHARHLTVSGELDLATSARLGDMINEMVASGIRLVVLDLTAVSFVDSSGLRVIIEAGDRLEECDGHLVLEGLSPAVQKLLEVTGLIDRYRHQGDPSPD